MNWGWKLTIVYIAFAAGILTLVFKSKGAKMDLVVKDYYQQELAFEKRIEATQNVTSLSEKPTIAMVNKEIVVQFPKEVLQQSPVGEIELYRPSDVNKDRKWTMTPNEEGIQKCDIQEMPLGIYLVRLKWTALGKEYFKEEALYIQ